MTTNSAVNGHCPEVVRKAWTDCNRTECSTRWSYYPDIGQACTATGTAAWPEFDFGRRLYDACECYGCYAANLITQTALRRSAPGHLSITIAYEKVMSHVGLRGLLIHPCVLYLVRCTYLAPYSKADYTREASDLQAACEPRLYKI